MKLDSDSDAWELEDAEERHRNAPDIYSVPAIAERTNRREGDCIELLFLFRGRDEHGLFIQSERLTVTIRNVSPSGYVGTLNSPPVSSALLHVGDAVCFEARHISSIRASGRG